MSTKIGVLALQGAISEHLEIVERALKELAIEGRALAVRKSEDLEELDAIIIPGGESTTISRLLENSKMLVRIKNLEIPMMGTCAGCVLLAKEVEGNNVKTIGLMDMRVRRNAFGRQKESFEAELELEIADFKRAYHAVFIRAPIITKVWSNCRVLAKFNDKIVAAQQNNLIALAFHSELTNDTRIHKYFIKLIKKLRGF
jgi:5'-phosphate synthase pdxT subunit